MKTIQDLYKEVKDEKRTEFDFLIEVRKRYPSEISSLLNYRDTVNRLKNLGYLYEDKNVQKKDRFNLNDAINRFKVTEEVSKDRLLKIIEIAERYNVRAPQVASIDWVNEEELITYLTQNMIFTSDIPKFKKEVNRALNESNDADSFPLEQIQKGIQYELYVKMKLDLNEIPNREQYDKAKKKAIQNLKKDPLYYVNLKAGIKKTSKKRTDLYQFVDKKKTNLIDKPNQMKKLKEAFAKLIKNKLEE